MSHDFSYVEYCAHNLHRDFSAAVVEIIFPYNAGLVTKHMHAMLARRSILARCVKK